MRAFQKLACLIVALAVPGLAYGKKKGRSENAIVGAGGSYIYHSGTGYGVEAFLILGPKWQLGGAQSTTSVDLLETSADGESYGVVIDKAEMTTSVTQGFVRWFPFSGVFNILLGVAQREITGSFGFDADLGGGERMDSKLATTSLGTIASIGSQWRTQGFYLGIEWYGQMTPNSSTSSSSTTATGELADSSNEFNDILFESLQDVGGTSSIYGLITVGILL